MLRGGSERADVADERLDGLFGRGPARAEAHGAVRFVHVLPEAEGIFVGKAFEMFPLALALSWADMEASYYMEGSIK